MNKTKKGFTLIELLVVIAILAILMVAVVLTLNPSELLKQSRDSNRLSDIATLKTSIALYEADVATSSPLGTTNVCYVAVPSANCTSTPTFGEFKNVSGGVTATTSSAVDGTGWLPINFSLISAGSPVSQLPVDPINSVDNFYGYEASGTSLFKLTTKMESAKFTSGSADVQNSDGGSFDDTYEAGTGVSVL